MNNPSITVFIPTYNRLSLLKRAIYSVINCGIPVNLHVLDNCSSDGTYEWLMNLKINSPVNLEVTRHKENIGASANFAFGFSSIRTPYFVPLADDDELAPGFLSKAFQLAEANVDCIAVIGSRAFKKMGKWRANWNRNRNTGFLTPEIHIRDFLIYGHYVTWSAILWRTAIVHSNNIYEKAKRFGLPSDVYFQFEVFMSGPVYIIPIAAASFNTTQYQESSSVGLDLKSIQDYGNLFSSMKDKLRISLYFDSEDELNSHLKQFVLQCSRFIRYNREYAIRLGKELELDLVIFEYLNVFHPFIGFSEFPFLEEIKMINKSNTEPNGIIIRLLNFFK